MRTFLMALVACCAMTAISQVTITSTEKLLLPAGKHWTAPRFSPDGQSVFLTTSGYRGIWQFRPETGALQQITDEPGAGYGFSVSSDGTRLAYRRTSFGANVFDRTQEIIDLDLRTLDAVTLAKARDLSVPVYHANSVLYQEMEANDLAKTAGAATTRAVVLGVDDAGIALLLDGKRQSLDPFGKGRYIWPALSPDGTQLVAYEMARGTFVCDLSGKVTAELGRRDGPVWMRSGKWLVYMDDRDDGHALVSSDLYCVSPDGFTTVRLTDTPDLELEPECSPTDNVIVCTTLNGEVLLLRYAEVGE
ncbi:MAG: WD40-like Beta Propeller Repeat [Bacteroidetes bacterium]|nr:WD40-like Beta Propeller Repeat [Bacteroidota bacterium]